MKVSLILNKKMIFIVLLLPILIFGQVEKINFKEAISVSANLENIYDSNLEFSDIDNDGDYDMIMVGENKAEDYLSLLYINDGKGNFNKSNKNNLIGVSGGALSFADVNGDSFEDVLITGRNIEFKSSATLYMNDRKGNFIPKKGTPFTGINNGDVAFEDIDNDGDQDVLISGFNHDATGYEHDGEVFSKLYENDGKGNFTELKNVSIEGIYSGSSINFGDINGDGFQDLLLTGKNSVHKGSAYLYTNDGKGMFNKKENTNFQGIKSGKGIFRDINNDGFLDVIISGFMDNLSTTVTKLYTNDGKGIFSELKNHQLENICGTVAFADVDGDQKEELLITGINRSHTTVSILYTNNGNGVFSPIKHLSFVGVCAEGIGFADLDGDNYMDLVISGSIGFTKAIKPITKLYLNTSMD